jgi:glycolate oxidase iron-sulfur subunit
LEAARGELFIEGPARGSSYSVLRLLLKHVWLHPARLRFLFAITRLFRNTKLPLLLLKSRLPGLISPRFEFALGLLENSSGRINTAEQARVPTQTPSQCEATMLFTGCVGSGLFDRVNKATARVLTVNGFAVQTPDRQVCCGALHAHAGDLEGARSLARRNIEAFGMTDTIPIVTNAGGCGAMLASYGHLLEHDERFGQTARAFSQRVRDVSQQLETTQLKSGAAVTDERVTYDASCHLLYGQHAGEAPLKLVGSISDLNFVKLEGSERCCGGAGIYNLLEPELSRRVLEEKLANIKETGAQIVATGNPGCQMQIGAGAWLAAMDLKVCHPIELLDEAYQRAGIYSEGGS